jgi:cysteinyl-tRNA synthetase
MVEGDKMSKSRGNFFTARDLFAKGVTPAALRLELVRTHYRVNSNFTMQGLADCQRQIDRWARRRDELAAAAAGRTAAGGRAPGPIERALGEFTEALCDDLNVARAIAAVNSAVGESAGDSCPVRESQAFARIDSVLDDFGRNAPVASGADPLAGEVERLLEARKAARAAKQWAESDRIRDELLAMGVAIKDGPQGTSWSRIVR